MSNILQAPPPRIPIDPGPGGPGPGGPGGGPMDPGAGGPAPGGPGPDNLAETLPDDTTPPGGPEDSPIVSLLRQALLNLQKAARMTPDDVEASGISEIASKLHKVISMDQANRDSVSGAGPAVKMIRKAGALGGGGGNGGGGGGGGGGY